MAADVLDARSVPEKPRDRVHARPGPPANLCLGEPLREVVEHPAVKLAVAPEKEVDGVHSVLDMLSVPLSGCGPVGRRAARLLGTLEVDADPGAQCARRLGHRVDPLVLAATTHHHQVAGRRMEGDTGAAAGARLEKETARGPQREDGHDALGPAAGEPVAMPAGAVLAAPVEVEPEIVVPHPVVRRQGVAGSN